MPFRCPECAADTLRIVQHLELPPDSRSDEITLQIVKCSMCGFGGIAVYEESRRGALDSESVDHAGYYVGADDLRALRELMSECPRPGDRHCACEAHRRLGTLDASGRWNGLAGMRLECRFPMQYRPGEP